MGNASVDRESGSDLSPTGHAPGSPPALPVAPPLSGGAVSVVEQLHALAAERDGAIERAQALQTDLDQLTETLRQRDEQLRQAQKMAAIGRLASNMAHDFNNILGVIVGYSEAAGTTPDLDPAVAADLEEITRAGLRANDLTRQLLAFGRRQVAVPRAIDPGARLRGFERMLQRLMGEAVEVATGLPAEPAHIWIDPGHFEQIILNLAVNARDAMPNGGRLSFELAPVTLDDTTTLTRLDLAAGAYIRLVVRDTGHGMDAATLARVFEPFFTTKLPEQGSGLGLSIVAGIVRQYGGAIDVASRPGRGASFTILLPHVADQAAPEAPQATPALARGTGSILLVLDEPALRSLTHAVLQAAGYTVTEAGRGDDALCLGAAHEGALDLLITDISLPGLSGPDLAEHLRAVHPHLRVLFVSGYDDASLPPAYAAAPFLQKPFTPRAVARKIREVLDTSP